MASALETSSFALLTVAETACALRVSEKTIRRRLADGTLVARRLGRSVRVDGVSVARLLASPGELGTADGVTVQKNQLLAQPRLLRQRGRTRDWTGILNGEEVPLGTSDRDRAEKTLARMASEQGLAQSRRAWRVYPDTERGGFVLKYYDKDGRRRFHRIPGTVATMDAAQMYAGGWYAERVGHPAPASPRLGHESQLPVDLTFEQLGQLWTSGKLAQLYPDHIRPKVSASDDQRRLGRYVYPIIGSYRIADFEGSSGLRFVERVLAGLPSENFSSASRRQVMQAIHRLLTLAVYPGKLLTGNPLPRGFLPRPGRSRAKAYLYPSEDAQLLECVQVPLLDRLFAGFLVREGLRVGEALSLTWTDLDLERGVVHLDENKTDDARAWALDAGVAEAFRRWKKLRGIGAKTESLVIADSKGRSIDRFEAAENLRTHLKLAGVARQQLFEATESRMALRAHDLRATFITVNLALGRTEAWVTDRTGHKSSQMIYAYKRAARTHAELNLGAFKPLWEAIPELRDA